MAVEKKEPGTEQAAARQRSAPVPEPPEAEPQLQAARRAAEGDEVVEIKAAAVFDGLTLWHPQTGKWLLVDGEVETDYGPNLLMLPHRPMTTIPISVPVGTRSWTIPANTLLVLRIFTPSAASRRSEP